VTIRIKLIIFYDPKDFEAHDCNVKTNFSTLKQIHFYYFKNSVNNEFSKSKIIEYFNKNWKGVYRVAQ